MISLDLAALDFGTAAERPPVVILHGLFGSARNWASIARKLAESRTVHALDLRNHGGSPWAETMAYPEMAEDVLRFLDARGIARAAVIGHSMGGKTAMALALAHPDRVERLMVVDIAPVPYTHTHLPYVRAMQAVDLASVERRSQAEGQLTAVEDPMLRQFLLQNLAQEDGRFAWRINLDAIGRGMDGLTGFPAFPDGARYEGRTLFLGGGRADYLRPEHAPVIRRLFPGARIKILAQAGHWIHAEMPGRFVEVAQEFLKEE